MEPVLTQEENSFKAEQLQFPRVRAAYTDVEDDILQTLNKHNLSQDNIEIYLRVFKDEKQIELWAKKKDAKKYQHIKTYDVCRTSGTLGPKRKRGDLQIPEGYYHINRFNPSSSYHLSLGINYPNVSDQILGYQSDLGGDIFIHGKCVTIGCLPIQDKQIAELYILCLEARNNGQKTIPITIFPAKLNNEKFEQLSQDIENNKETIALWTDLKKGYDLFNQYRKLPSIGFKPDGRHIVKM